MRDEVKRAGFFILALILCIAGAIFIRAKFFFIEANADIIFPQETYADFGMVVDILYDNDLVVIQTNDGNQWVFVGTEDWVVGDCCCMVLNDNGTRRERSDDWIVDVRYVNIDDDYIPPYFRNMVAHL